jgi:hypothetical protein
MQETPGKKDGKYDACALQGRSERDVGSGDRAGIEHARRELKHCDRGYLPRLPTDGAERGAAAPRAYEVHSEEKRAHHHLDNDDEIERRYAMAAKQDTVAK